MNKTGVSKGMKELAETAEAGFVAPKNGTLQQDRVDTTPRMPEVSRNTSFTWIAAVDEAITEEHSAFWASHLENLLHSLDELEEMLTFSLNRKDWLNAYLLAAGMNQITEDYLHPDPLYLRKAEKYLRKMRGSSKALLVTSARMISRSLVWVNRLKPSIGNTQNWQRQLAALVDELARAVVEQPAIHSIAEEQLAEDGMAVTSQVSALPGQLRSSLLKLPSCFRSFDQQPADLRRMVDEFALHWPERDQLICVTGIRTSGSYLAPLFGATLKAGGYANVKVLTIRPGNQLTGAERQALRELVRQNGLALICDDPPISGSTIVKTTRLLEEAGIPAQRIIPVLQLTSDAPTLAALLQKYPSVLMPEAVWGIYQRLVKDELMKVLQGACAQDIKVSRLVRIDVTAENDSRGHVRGLYQVDLVDTCTSLRATKLIQVKGVGLGYFGEHEAAIASRLPGYSPTIIALKDGLLYQEIPNPPVYLDHSMIAKDGKWIDELVNYVIERNRFLPVGDDLSLKVKGRNAVWEVASNLLSSVFGRGWMLARLPLVDPIVKDILRANHPSIVDGDMALKNWQISKNPLSPLVKMELAERAFSHMDLASYDPAYDLAGLAVEIDDDAQAGRLRSSYDEKTGGPISAERWMLYQLVHVWDLNRQHTLTDQLARRRMAKIVEGYFSEMFFSDLPGNNRGGICALDIDGVLETNQLGFPSLTASSARSLRRLAEHGYRVLLATGRSLDEVKERCAAYHLAGGVAEYGAVLYDRASNKSVTLLEDGERGTLLKLRGRLLNTKEICLDADYRYCVRAFRLDKAGKQHRLSDETINKVLNDTGTSAKVSVIQGITQTDFMVTRINKGAGLQAWLARFEGERQNSTDGSENGKPIALAVGDSAADQSMFTLARLAYAPAHAEVDRCAAGVHFTTQVYQRGLEQAVTKFIGHAPGACQVCSEKEFSSQTRSMLRLLSMQEGGRANMLVESIRLYRRKGGN